MAAFQYVGSVLTANAYASTIYYYLSNQDAQSGNAFRSESDPVVKRFVTFQRASDLVTHEFSVSVELYDFVVEHPNTFITKANYGIRRTAECDQEYPMIAVNWANQNGQYQGDQIFQVPRTVVDFLLAPPQAS
jgi:hypothetical protein